MTMNSRRRNSMVLALPLLLVGILGSLIAALRRLKSPMPYETRNASACRRFSSSAPTSMPRSRRHHRAALGRSLE